MKKFITGNSEKVKAFCTLLGIDSDKVFAIDIRIRPDEIVTALVERVIGEDELGSLITEKIEWIAIEKEE